MLRLSNTDNHQWHKLHIDNNKNKKMKGSTAIKSIDGGALFLDGQILCSLWGNTSRLGRRIWNGFWMRCILNEELGRSRCVIFCHIVAILTKNCQSALEMPKRMALPKTVRITQWASWLGYLPNHYPRGKHGNVGKQDSSCLNIVFGTLWVNHENFSSPLWQQQSRKSWRACFGVLTKVVQ